MFKHYFKIAFRNLERNKIYSFINIAGLSIGLACAMLIMLYVNDESSFDKFHKNVNNIYRVVSKASANGVEYKNSNTGFLPGPRFTQNVPGITSFVRVEGNTEDIKQGNDIHSQDLLYVDSNFFRVFSFPLIAGDFRTCLKEPRSIVLSEDAAKKQFGTTDAVGKIVMVKQDSAFVPFKVTAVSKKCPQNSSIQFDVLLPLKESDADAQNSANWFDVFLNTFVVVNDHADLATIEKQMQSFYVKDATIAFKEIQKKYGGNGTTDAYSLQPYTDMHMNTELTASNGLSNASNPMYSYILSGIALFILLIACINFINLTVARSVKRAKEIGIRKVIGGDRRQLIVQFLGESFILCTIAFLLAIGLVDLVLPVFNNLANKALSLSYLFTPKLISEYILLYIITGLLAGSYPALVLSGYNPVATLYNRFNVTGKNYLQKTLVVLQFSLASFLIIATFTIYAQFNFLTHTDLGYDDNNIIVVDKWNANHNEADLFKTTLLKNPNFVDVAPNNVGHEYTIAKVANDSVINFCYAPIDESYFPELKIPVIQGRNFSNNYPADPANSIIVNETFARRAGWKNPIGQSLNFFYNNNEIYHVIGVVKDYHFQSLSQKIAPVVFTMKNNKAYASFYIKIKPNTAATSLKYIQKTFKDIFPLSPYSYVFKNDENIKNYESEAKWKQIILFGAIITIFISCIGLFGLSVLSAEKRTKEIGIRKVLGASVASVTSLLSKDFMKLVCIALIIAMPAAYIAGNKWLESYPYRTAQSWWLFAIAAVLVTIIALLTISYQAIKAAIANPVKSLRTE
jgi:putative ABC transport system permease protein